MRPTARAILLSHNDSSRAAAPGPDSSSLPNDDSSKSPAASRVARLGRPREAVLDVDVDAIAAQFQFCFLPVGIASDERAAGVLAGRNQRRGLAQVARPRHHMRDARRSAANSVAGRFSSSAYDGKKKS